MSNLKLYICCNLWIIHIWILMLFSSEYIRWQNTNKSTIKRRFRILKGILSMLYMYWFFFLFCFVFFSFFFLLVIAFWQWYCLSAFDFQIGICNIWLVKHIRTWSDKILSYEEYYTKCTPRIRLLYTKVPTRPFRLVERTDTGEYL